jgi:hypothetical protein
MVKLVGTLVVSVFFVVFTIVKSPKRPKTALLMISVTVVTIIVLSVLTIVFPPYASTWLTVLPLTVMAVGIRHLQALQPSPYK